MTRRTRGSSGPVREREFHSWLARTLPAGRSGLLPLGDDAAALRPPRGAVAVVSTDTLVEGTHFLRSSLPTLVGAAAAGVSLSDIAAKGAVPAATLLALVVPVGTPREWAQQVVRGAERLGSRFGAHVVGGDTKPGPTRSVTSTVIGWGRPATLTPRSGARAGDVLGTTGTVGRGGLAAARLARGGSTARKALVEMLDVRPRVREGIALATYAHAMIDTSDGIADSARLLAAASHVRVVVEENLLPLVRGVRAAAPDRQRLRTIVFYGGDYELLAAVAPRNWDRAVGVVERTGGRLTRVGRVERGSGATLETAGRPGPLPPAGWQPFGTADRLRP